MSEAQLPLPVWDGQISAMAYPKRGPWIVSVAEYIFNDRVCLTHEDEYPHSMTAGFCYDKGGAAHAAAAVWDPEQDLRPVGFKKEAFNGRG